MRILLLILVFLFLASCKPGPGRPGIPPAVKSNKELVVLTRQSPTTFFKNADGQYAGLEYDLVTLFAEKMGWKTRFVVVERYDEILPALQQHQAHLAAAGISASPEFSKLVKFGSPYQAVQQQLVYNANNEAPSTLADLIEKQIEVVAGSSAVEVLQEARQKVNTLSWIEVPDQNSDKILERLANGSIDYAVVSSDIVDVARNFYPDIDIAFTLGKPQNLAWAFPKDANPRLIKKANEFFAKIKRDGTLQRLLDRYYGHIKRLNQQDIQLFIEKMRTTLPRYRKYFHEAQEISGIDWRLLAAIGFQESHWDPLAISPTGVRGLMMLTAETADRMKVKNRLDPRENILAGSQYFADLRDELPESVPEPDRTWLALATYNIGYGHLQDARALARKKKLNPDLWVDMKKVLPLLSRPDVLPQLRYGFARGGESVIMTENIRTYYDILAKFETPYKSVFPSLDSNISVTPLKKNTGFITGPPTGLRAN